MDNMTDHFADCNSGDIVTVTLRGEFKRANSWLGYVEIGNHGFCTDENAITSITIEPRPLGVGDRIRTRTGARGEIKAICEGLAWVWNTEMLLGSWPLPDLERAP